LSLPLPTSFDNLSTRKGLHQVLWAGGSAKRLSNSRTKLSQPPACTSYDEDQTGKERKACAEGWTEHSPPCPQHSQGGPVAEGVEAESSMGSRNIQGASKWSLSKSAALSGQAGFMQAGTGGRRMSLPGGQGGNFKKGSEWRRSSLLGGGPNGGSLDRNSFTGNEEDDRSSASESSGEWVCSQRVFWDSCQNDVRTLRHKAQLLPRFCITTHIDAKLPVVPDFSPFPTCVLTLIAWCPTCCAARLCQLGFQILECVLPAVLHNSL